jgi:hypothetical protein
MTIHIILNARLQPSDRAELEDTLQSLLGPRGLKLDFPSGGTLLLESGEPSEADFEVTIEEPSQPKIDLLLKAVGLILAPKGSRYLLEGSDTPVAFGNHEGLALYLNGTDLPADVYANSDVNYVMQQCDELAGAKGRIRSYWEGSEGTALYMYGPSFEDIKDAIEPLTSTYPLCQKCRIERIA